jgi:hypothetical protein
VAYQPKSWTGTAVRLTWHLIVLWMLMSIAAIAILGPIGSVEILIVSLLSVAGTAGWERLRRRPPKGP